jgi:hypothetical protein
MNVPKVFDKTYTAHRSSYSDYTSRAENRSQLLLITIPQWVTLRSLILLSLLPIFLRNFPTIAAVAPSS